MVSVCVTVLVLTVGLAAVVVVGAVVVGVMVVASEVVVGVVVAVTVSVTVDGGGTTGTCVEVIGVSDVVGVVPEVESPVMALASP